MGDHSGFDLAASNTIREVDASFRAGAAVGNVTPQVQHTKAYPVPVAGDWWKFTLFGAITISGDSTKKVHINFGADAWDFSFLTTETGEYWMQVLFVTDGAGNANVGHFVSHATGAPLRINGNTTSAAFPTTAGSISVELSTLDASDSISILGLSIESGGSA